MTKLTTTVILGVLEITTSWIETVEEIKEHIQEVLSKISAKQLITAPDC